MQEVIVQNFRAKPGTRMASHPEPSLDDHLWTIAVARILLGPAWHVQAPPNLAFDDFPRLLDAGIDDWGGVSPVTIDHVNPEAPWPELERLAEATRSRGLELAPRLPLYPEYVAELDRWVDPAVAPHVRRAADASGLARDDAWAPGEPVASHSSSAATRRRSTWPATNSARTRSRACWRRVAGRQCASSPPPTGCAARSAATRSRTS